MSGNKTGKSVSIITITQAKRFECIKILFKMIQWQTYQNIKEWVIVEGSSRSEDAIVNEKLINDFSAEVKPLINYTIKYIKYTGYKLGGLRNLGNASCSSDIIVCCDDDDYYPPTRVSEAVEKLSSSPCLIAGLSNIYLYDFYLDKLYKFRGFMEYHSSNNAMAYKKEFLIENSHDPEIQVGEERSFTKEFTIPLVKVDSRKSIICISHNTNTYNKRGLCLTGTLQTVQTLDEIDEPITNYIDPEIFGLMKKIYYDEKKSEYDVAYLLGMYSLSFNPMDKSLDRTLLPIMKFAEYCVKEKGKKVAIFGEFDLENEVTLNGIDFIHWKKFPYHHIFNTLILAGPTGILNGLPFKLKADKIIWDYHGHPIGDEKLNKFWNKYNNKVNTILLRSAYQLTECNKILGNMNNYKLIPNGVDLDKFQNNVDNIKRNPYRFCYTTNYESGLEYMIRNIFPIIYQKEPRAELHIYSGLETITNEIARNNMQNLFATPGVCDHGKQPYEIIAREKHLSTFHLYIANIVNEVDTADIRESIVAGCIPLISTFGVFNETDGVKFNINYNDINTAQLIANTILTLIKSGDKLEILRKHLQKSNKIESWNTVCQKIYDVCF